MSHQRNGNPESSPTLVNTWVLVAFAGKKLVEGVPAELTFTDAGRVFGTVGVNRIMGDYHVTPDTVTFTTLATTMMMGPPNAQAQESMLLDFLHGELSYLIEGQTLTISSYETKVLEAKSREKSAEAGE